MRVLVALILSLLFAPMAFAEIVYVDDTLRVGVRPEPDNSYAPVSVVVSGMALEVLERKGTYLFIRTPSGVEGWVSNSYITKKKPSQVLLEEAMAKEKELTKQIETLTANLDTHSKDLNKLKQDYADLEQENNDLNDQLSESDRIAGLLTGGAIPWWQSMIFLIIIAAAAFVGGAVWWRKHTAKRLGGFTI